MKRSATLSVCCAALAALCVQGQVHAQASAQASAKAVTGPYLGTAFGAAFGNREIDDANSRNDERIGHSARLFGGYQLNEHFGVQAGCVRLHGLNQNTGTGPTLLERTVNGHSAYLAGTARLPLGRSFALTGKLGASFGKVTGVSPASAANKQLLGSHTALLVGTGAEYVFDRSVSFTVELDSYGKISRQVKGNTLALGSRFMF
jgi:OmpA-OmpF porin, OOP family